MANRIFPFDDRGERAQQAPKEHTSLPTSISAPNPIPDLQVKYDTLPKSFWSEGIVDQAHLDDTEPMPRHTSLSSSTPEVAPNEASNKHSDGNYTQICPVEGCPQVYMSVLTSDRLSVFHFLIKLSFF